MPAGPADDHVGRRRGRAITGSAPGGHDVGVELCRSLQHAHHTCAILWVLATAVRADHGVTQDAALEGQACSNIHRHAGAVIVRVTVRLSADIGVALGRGHLTCSRAASVPWRLAVRVGLPLTDPFTLSLYQRTSYYRASRAVVVPSVAVTGSRPLWGLTQSFGRLLDSPCSPSRRSVPAVKSVCAVLDECALPRRRQGRVWRPRWHRPGRAPHTKAGRGTRTSGLAGVVTVVLATLRAVVAPILGAAVVPGTIEVGRVSRRPERPAAALRSDG